MPCSCNVYRAGSGSVELRAKIFRNEALGGICQNHAITGNGAESIEILRGRYHLSNPTYTTYRFMGFAFVFKIMRF